MIEVGQHVGASALQGSAKLCQRMGPGGNCGAQGVYDHRLSTAPNPGRNLLAMIRCQMLQVRRGLSVQRPRIQPLPAFGASPSEPRIAATASPDLTPWLADEPEFEQEESTHDGERGESDRGTGMPGQSRS
jgi:hypothetical protein